MVRLLLDEVTGSAGRDLSYDELASFYAYPAAVDRPYLRANMVSTLDGSAVGADGRTGSINTGVDRDVFALMRALADVIVVGAGTARAERYGPAGTPTGPASSGLAPAMVVVSRSGSLPEKLLRPGQGKVFLATCAAADPSALERSRTALGDDRVVVHGDADVDLAAMVAWCGTRGWRHVLCEGGPHLLHDLLSAGLVDELCLTTTPLLVAGDGPRILSGGQVAESLEPMVLLEEDGTLLGRWRVVR